MSLVVMFYTPPHTHTHTILVFLAWVKGSRRQFYIWYVFYISHSSFHRCSKHIKTYNSPGILNYSYSDYRSPVPTISLISSPNKYLIHIFFPIFKKRKNRRKKVILHLRQLKEKKENRKEKQIANVPYYPFFGSKTDSRPDLLVLWLNPNQNRTCCSDYVWLSKWDKK